MKSDFRTLVAGKCLVCMFLALLSGVPAVLASETRLYVNPAEKKAGCQTARRLASGEMSYDRLTPGQRLELDLFRQNYPADYDACAGVKAAESPISPGPARLSYEDMGLPVSSKVIQVIDGNTLMLGNGQRLELIGVRVPTANETECAALLKELVLNKTVNLEYDVQKRDRFARLMAYVFLEDGTFLNRIPIEKGLAEAEIVSPNFMYQDALLGKAPSAVPAFPENEALQDYNRHAKELSTQRRRMLHQLYIAWGAGVGGALLIFFFRLVKYRRNSS